MRRLQKSQQLATLAALAFARNGRSAGDTPTPGYARSPVFLHSGSDDGDGVGETVAATDELRVADCDIDALTDGVIVGVAGGGAGATRVELALGARPSDDVALRQIVALMAKHVPRPTVALGATKINAAQLVKIVLRLAQKPQQLDMPVPLIFTRDGSSAGDTPSPEYGRRAVPAHSGNDDGDTVGVIVAATDADAVSEAETEADTEVDIVVDAARLGEMEELGVTDIENDGGALFGLTIKIDVRVST